MKLLTLGLSVAALAVAGTAQAAPGDARRDGVTTRAEMQERAAKRFDRLDANDDGKVDPADHAQRREARRAARFDRLDANDDGQLSRSEFESRPALAEGRQRGQVRRGNGLRRMAMGGPRRGVGQLRRADADRDGAVTQAEFAAIAMQRFDRLDANRDGSVTRDERQALRAERRERRQERTGRQRMTPPPAG